MKNTSLTTYSQDSVIMIKDVSWKFSWEMEIIHTCGYTLLNTSENHSSHKKNLNTILSHYLEVIIPDRPLTLKKERYLYCSFVFICVWRLLSHNTSCSTLIVHVVLCSPSQLCGMSCFHQLVSISTLFSYASPTYGWFFQ